MPSTKPTNRIRCASPTAATASLAEPADQREVGRHHGDLAELGQRDRPSELDRFDDLGAPRRVTGRRSRPAAAMVPGNVMARHHSGCRGKRKAGHARGLQALVRGDEEFAVAVAARDRRGDDAADVPAERRDERRDVVADRGVNERIAHDALLDQCAGRPRIAA